MAMIAAAETPPTVGCPPSVTFPERLRFTREGYRQLAEAGILDPDRPVELLNGDLVYMSPVGVLHRGVVDDLNEFFSDRRRGRFRVSVQNPQAASVISEPEPDIQLLRVRDDRYRDGHPKPEDVFLAIEVADTSLAKDLGPKKQVYAAAGIVEYWVVDLVNRKLVVHREPDQRAADYRQIAEHADTAKVAPRVAEDCELDLAWLFGPAQGSPAEAKS